MANFNWGTGKQKHNILGNKGTTNVLGNTGAKHTEKEDKKLKHKTFSLQPCPQHFFFQSVWMELRQWLK